MAKAGMKRPDSDEVYATQSNKKLNHSKNDVNIVPEIQGKAKTGNKKAKNIIR